MPAKTEKQVDKKRERKFSMSDILSLISLTVVFTLVFAVAFHYWELGAIRQATWWGFGAFVVAALGVAFAIDAKIRSEKSDTKSGTTETSKIRGPSTDRPAVGWRRCARD
jgi:FtsH-binding integral membrane protein